MTTTDPAATAPTTTGAAATAPTTTGAAATGHRTTGTTPGSAADSAAAADPTTGPSGTGPGSLNHPGSPGPATEATVSATPEARSGATVLPVGGTEAPAPGPGTATPGGTEVLASDPEREHVAGRLREAAAEGRLTLAESGERQAAAYAARTRAELVPLVSDLPRPHRPRRPRRGELTPRARRNLTVHAGVTAALLSIMVLAWAVGAAPFFWPAGPTFWLLLILFVHSRRAERGPSPDDAVPTELR